MLEAVARMLDAEVRKRSGQPERDAFGRSAFNRFYYCAFLVVREALAEMSSEWRGAKHASVPGLLEGAVTKRIRKGISDARRADDIGTQRACGAAKRAARELADLMLKARQAREIADYHSDVPIVFEDEERYSLNEVSITVAKQWPARSAALTRAIIEAWRQIDD